MRAGHCGSHLVVPEQLSNPAAKLMWPVVSRVSLRHYLIVSTTRQGFYAENPDKFGIYVVPGEPMDMEEPPTPSLSNCISRDFRLYYLR